MDEWLHWITENGPWVFSGVGVLVLGGLGRVLFKRPRKRAPTPLDPTFFSMTASANSFNANGSVNATAQHGSTAVVAAGNVKIGISIEEYEKQLKKKIKESLDELATAEDEKNKQDREFLKKELDAAKTKLNHLDEAYREQKLRLEESASALQEFKRHFGPTQINSAKEHLAKGDTTNAESLLLEARSQSKKTAAEAAYQLGFLAESRIDLRAANGFFREAIMLDPKNSAYFDSAGRVEFTLGQYNDALRCFKSALSIEEARIGGRHHPNIATVLNNLGAVYDLQGNYDEAVKHYSQALKIRERALGQDNIQVGQSLNNLAGVYKSLGRFKDAQTSYERALSIFEQDLGHTHPGTATILNNLAALHHANGDFDKAAKLYKRALEIRESHYGKNNLLVGHTINNLAEVYRVQGKYDIAEPLYKRDLAISEDILGSDHPEVATTLNNLAELYRTQGLFDKAEPLYRRSLEIRQNRLDSNHPHIAQSFNNLGELYRHTGNLSAAKQQYRHALSIWQEILPPHHPDIGLAHHCIAAINEAQGVYDEAERLYKIALDIREKSLNPSHPDVAKTVIHLAELYDKQGRINEAEPLYKRAIEIFEKKFGIDNPKTRNALSKYAEFLNNTNRESDALMLFARIDKELRKAIAKRMAEEIIERQNIKLTASETLTVEKELERRIQNPESATGPITITRPIIIDRKQSGGSASSPISDERAKRNVRTITNAIDKVMALRGVEFDWKDHWSEKIDQKYSARVGLLAQEVKEVIPELVDITSDGYMMVHYSNLVAILIEAIKEQQGQIDDLKNQLRKNATKQSIIPDS